MIRKLFEKINQKWNSIHQAALLLGFFSLLSQLLGLVRDRMFAHSIGPGETLDIYYAAFRIPDFLYLSIASLASITVLMPFLIERMKDNKEKAREFLNDVLFGFLTLLVITSAIVFIFMKKIAVIVAPGFSEQALLELVTTSRIMLLSPIFLGLSNMLGTVTQLLRKFFIFSLSPIFYNVGIIIGLVFFYPKFGVNGLAFGVALGALLHLLVQLPTVISAGFTPNIIRRFSKPVLKEVIMLSLPRTLGLSMNSLALLVVMAIGSTMTKGSISIFNLSFNLETVPVMIIGISYAVASFPTLAEAYSKSDMVRWKSCILSAIKQIIFWSLPLATLFIVLRAQIVRVVLGSGAFTWSDTKLTAACLALFSLSIISQNMILVTVRGFYSAHNTKKPLLINTFSAGLIIFLSFLFVYLFKNIPIFHYFITSLLRVDDNGSAIVLMLPLAYSIGTTVNAILHYRGLKKNYIKEDGGVYRTLFQSIAASFAIGIVAYGVLNIVAPLFDLHTTAGLFLQGLVAGLSGIFAGIIVLIVLKSEPFFALIVALKEKLWKTNIEVVETQ